MLSLVVALTLLAPLLCVADELALRCCGPPDHDEPAAAEPAQHEMVERPPTSSSASRWSVHDDNLPEQQPTSTQREGAQRMQVSAELWTRSLVQSGLAPVPDEERGAAGAVRPRSMSC